MDASRPLLEKERDGYESHHQKHHHRRGTNGVARNGSLADPSADCLSRLFPPTSSVTSDSSGRDSFGSGGPFASPTKNNGYHHHHHHHHDSERSRNGFGNDYETEKPSKDRNACSEMLNCTEWFCWKWIFPERIMDYDDFATSAQMGEIYYIRQKARELFDSAMPDDEEMLHHLWNGLFPMLPYEGRVNPRWRDVGFQNDDPGSDLRASGRLALKMLLYFSDHHNDEFKRMIRENRFPVCLCALNMIEILLVHLNLKDPLPLVCPCCGTDNAELETSQPSRPRPELKGFISILNDTCGAASSNQHSFAEWPVEAALAQLFMHSMIVLDAVWKQKLFRDPTTNLMHFREALYETRLRLVAFLSRRNSPLTLVELRAWSYKQTSKLRTHSSKMMIV
uniref:ELMO domain-containing protein n=1 Tax=Globisporangium ultimum (strain ATCC 200006 / CBS 805.95 / DAOM BR144) TaxID=431595 RepID=K3X360_GLOUD